MQEKIERLIRNEYGEVEYSRLGMFEGQECYMVSLAEEGDWLADDYFLLFDDMGNLVRSVSAAGQFINEGNEETRLSAKIAAKFGV